MSRVFSSKQCWNQSIQGKETVVCRINGLNWHRMRFVWVSTGTHWRHVSIFGDDRASPEPGAHYYTNPACKVLNLRSWFINWKSLVISNVNFPFGLVHITPSLASPKTQCCMDIYQSAIGQRLVQLGNTCCARFALLVILCVALQIHWVDPWL